MIDLKIRRLGGFLFLFLLLAASILPAGPALTIVQDTLYKADGTPFTGLLYIDWKSFTTGDAQNVATHNVVATVVNGVLRVQLAPTSNATPSAWYQVRYNSNGAVQFTEYWNVPSSPIPVALKNVRMPVPPGMVGTTPPPAVTAIQIQDVTGLSDELSARVLRGPGLQPSRAAVVNPSGMLESAIGNSYDCMRVDGTSGPCGGGGTTPAFVDGELPSGNVDGSNAVFTLAGAPVPAASLSLFRNGVLQKPGADFDLSGNTVTFNSAAVPASGDLLMASYRITPQGAVTGALGGALTGDFPNPSLGAGVVADYNVAPGAGIAESKLSLNYPSHSSANDPTPEQKQGMAGTAGVVSGSNRFVTDQDPRLTDARAPKAHSLLSAAHTDTAAGQPVRGDLMVAQGQGIWTRLPLGAPNRCLMSNGADAVWNTCLFTGFATGSLPFVDAGGSLAQNNSRLFWDNSNRRFGIGTNAPTSTLQVQDANPLTGSTTLTVRAGQGQSLNPLQRWMDLNGVELGRMDGQGVLSAMGFQTSTTAWRAAWRDAGAATDPGNLVDGDAWFNTAVAAHRTREAGQTHTQPQVLCGSMGGTTAEQTPASLGTCTIPSGLLQPGDRLELKFDYSHDGSSAGFSIEVRIGQLLMLTRSFPATEGFLSGAISGGIYNGGMQWSGHTQGRSMAMQPETGAIIVDTSSDIPVDLRGSMDQRGAETITLRNFSLIRYPAQLNP